MTAERMDHISAAKNWVENSVNAQASQQPNNEQLSAAYATVGLVHATLALAEQQRIANLIAIYGSTSVVEGGYTASGVDFGYLAQEIREALGLS